MKMAKKETSAGESLTPEHILTGHTPEVREICERLRSLVRNAVPEASEAAYPTWHGIGYRHPQSGYFCAIFPHHNQVKLGFEYGILLPDPEGLLSGKGKQVRYVLISQLADIRPEAINDLIHAAISLPAEREAKLWLINNR
jgi:hypothetical protein